MNSRILMPVTFRRLIGSLPRINDLNSNIHSGFLIPSHSSSCQCFQSNKLGLLLMFHALLKWGNNIGSKLKITDMFVADFSSQCLHVAHIQCSMQMISVFCGVLSWQKQPNKNPPLWTICLDKGGDILHVRDQSKRTKTGMTSSTSSTKHIQCWNGEMLTHQLWTQNHQALIWMCGGFCSPKAVGKKMSLVGQTVPPCSSRHMELHNLVLSYTLQAPAMCHVVEIFTTCHCVVSCNRTTSKLIIAQFDVVAQDLLRFSKPTNWAN